MTILEGIVALVLVSLTAIGVLELFQNADRSASEAVAWTTATAYAEQEIEAAKIGKSAIADLARSPVREGFSRRLTLEPSVHGLTDATVVVGLPNGASLTIHRLMTTNQ